MQNGKPLVSDCVEVLKQGLALLSELDDEIYAQASSVPAQAAVGGHLRHCLDFYNSFLAGVASGRVDYNQRERDALVERVRVYAAVKLETVIDELVSLRVTNGATPLLVALEGARGSWCESTVLRELQFLLSHTIHHYALIALLLRLQGVEPDQEFGVNPSTLDYWRNVESRNTQAFRIPPSGGHEPHYDGALQRKIPPEGGTLNA